LKNRSRSLNPEMKLQAGRNLPQSAAPTASVLEALPRGLPAAQNRAEATGL